MSSQKNSQNSNNFDAIDAEEVKAPQPRGLFARLRGYFFAGILVTAPISITIYLVWTLFNLVDYYATRLIPEQYNPSQYFEYSVPGIGLIIALLLLIVIGFITTNFMGRYVIILSERILDRLPFIRSIYSSIKQILETIFTEQEKAFRDVVLLEYPRKGLWAVGFVASRAKGQIQDDIEGKLLNVFVPTTPNPTSGYLLFVPEKDVHFLDMTVDEGLKLVVSAGIVAPPTKKKRSPASKTEQNASKQTS